MYMISLQGVGKTPFFLLNNVLDTKIEERCGGARECDHFHWKLYHIRVNRPQKSTLNEYSRVDQKTPLTRDMGLLSHPK